MYTHTLVLSCSIRSLESLPSDFIFMSNLSVIIAVGKHFNLWVVFCHSQNGLHGTKLLSIVLLHISSTLSFLLCALNLDIQEMLQFPVLLVLFGIVDSCLWLHQLPSSKILFLIPQFLGFFNTSGDGSCFYIFYYIILALVIYSILFKGNL